ncbi:MAG: type II toxin-antitoxin system RelE/ParE family toxin [Ignavibacteriales bacterium]|nr:type II toxin-antitoxin system RelE/ParE family toxin [Ignavibacteriales bacterium]
MLIVETPVFTKRILEISTDDEYRQLQHFIVQHPDAGDIIPGSHGLRKLRWTISGKGKRGGTRVIYYWVRPRDTILMLFVFKKNERSNLTKDQIKTLKAIAAKELR